MSVSSSRCTELINAGTDLLIMNSALPITDAEMMLSSIKRAERIVKNTWGAKINFHSRNENDEHLMCDFDESIADIYAWIEDGELRRASREFEQLVECAAFKALKDLTHKC
jgi:hypothetical protein